ncbi:hypothetical protein Fmac_022024 [Flemingia macrophylla]|uniref:Cyclic nucleotide-binding domain-containing protein n=1 Tax=Flemingia macrophylla TaxID=520843 RepID=A0ABD1LYJ3_9FABA
MASDYSRFVRFQDDVESAKFPTTIGGNRIKLNGTQVDETSGKKAHSTRKTGKFLKARVLSRVFSEDYERVRKRTLLDPRGQTIHRWNKIFLVACLVSLFVDPLFFYLPVVRDEVCIDIGTALEVLIWIVIPNLGGASWYLLSIERQEACWRSVCDMESSYCEYGFFDCKRVEDSLRVSWFMASNVTILCSPKANFFQFGIYGDAVTSQVTTSSFFDKYFFCLWWGLRNLSSLGQGLLTSTFVGEIMFAIVVATFGLVLFALLIGNMQTYLQSTTVRLEEWRVKRSDTEQWMHHRQLPPELRQAVRKYNQYKWVATRGVDEEALLKGLPPDLRRDIKRHLCLELVRRKVSDLEQVPLLDEMEERMVDAICERLKPALCTESTYMVREGDPVNEMLFIIRGHLDSYTTDGGRSGFFNSCRIGPGDFCGEELLTWTLGPRPTLTLPSSSRSVKAVSEVEAFALTAEDLRFVASQFRRLHSKQVRHKFRFYSHQWRTWAACFVQAAWRRYRKRKPNTLTNHSLSVNSFHKPQEPYFSLDD